MSMFMAIVFFNLLASILGLYIICLQTLSHMKKIKYGNKKAGPENRELEDLKEGDEICEGVLESFGEGYVDYLTNLLKNAKTPNKSIPKKQIDHNSSDEQLTQNWSKELPARPQKQEYSYVQPKIRRHSEASAKISTMDRECQFNKFNKSKNQSTKVSPVSKGIEQQKELIPAQKSKKRKIEYINNEFTLKNQQKTMQFSRNTVQNTRIIDDDKDASKKSRITHKSRQKYYVTSQNYEDSDHEPSIQVPLKRQSKKLEERASHQNFIDNINEYITTLQQNQSVNIPYYKKDSEDEKQRLFKKMQKSKKLRIDDEYDIQDILKQNFKLTKRIKLYEEKVSQLDEEIANTLNQFKNKQKTYKNKINHLLRGLLHAFMKIDSQQQEIASLKDLHRSYGQKVKQIQSKYDEDNVLDDIRQEIFKNLAPKRHTSEIRTKHKKVLEDTLPRYDEDRRYW